MQFKHVKASQSYKLRDYETAKIIHITFLLPNIHYICNALYSEKLKSSEVRHYEVSDYFWNDVNNRKDAMRWLVKENLKLNHTDALSSLKKEHFSQYVLTVLFQIYIIVQ